VLELQQVFCVSVFKNNDWQQIAKALMFDPALEMFLPAIATCVLVQFILVKF
jgi:hypothetical protein